MKRFIRKIPKKIVLSLILFYQKRISPFFGPVCRFYPSCSHYGYSAVIRFGVVRGSILIIIRLLRCQPWCVGGYDPIVKKSFSHHLRKALFD